MILTVCIAKKVVSTSREEEQHELRAIARDFLAVTYSHVVVHRVVVDGARVFCAGARARGSVASEKQKWRERRVRSPVPKVFTITGDLFVLRDE